MIQICLYIFSSYFCEHWCIDHCVPWGDVVTLQARVFKEFPYLDRGCQSRKEEQEQEEWKKGVKKGGKVHEEWREEGQESISLNLPGKNHGKILKHKANEQERGHNYYLDDNI